MPDTAFSEGGGLVVCIWGADIFYLASDQNWNMSTRKSLLRSGFAT
jgi:hypothetical protein